MDPFWCAGSWSTWHTIPSPTTASWTAGTQLGSLAAPRLQLSASRGFLLLIFAHQPLSVSLFVLDRCTYHAVCALGLFPWGTARRHIRQPLPAAGRAPSKGWPTPAAAPASWRRHRAGRPGEPAYPQPAQQPALQLVAARCIGRALPARAPCTQPGWQAAATACPPTRRPSAPRAVARAQRPRVARDCALAVRPVWRD